MRHGLSLSLFADVAYSAEIERFANEIVSESKNKATIVRQEAVTKLEGKNTRNEGKK
jgi:hypothetical protein